MQTPIVVIGVGEIGGVMARGFLRAGHPVFPVTRSVPMDVAIRHYPEPELALVAVSEDDLQPVLQGLPGSWRDRAALIQNELLPYHWQAAGLTEPTVISVWFEKKPGQEINRILPSPIHGPHAESLRTALAAVDIATRQVDDPDEMLFELVRKNVYILTTNIAGLVVGGTTGELWEQHRELAYQVAHEVIAIQAWLTGRELDEGRLVAGVAEAIHADPAHKNTGRAAPKRLARALEHAQQAGLEVPKLREIQASAI